MIDKNAPVFTLGGLTKFEYCAIECMKSAIRINAPNSQRAARDAIMYAEALFEELNKKTLK